MFLAGGLEFACFVWAGGCCVYCDYRLSAKNMDLPKSLVLVL